MKSNITIASNIYNRISGDIMRDPGYIARVNEAKALKKLAPMLGGTLSAVRLSSWQEQVIRESEPCAYNRHAGRADATHGLVQIENGFVWSCRCEHITCERYESCMADANAVRILRDEANKHTATTKENAPPLSFKYEHLGDISNIFEPPVFEDADDTYENEFSDYSAFDEPYDEPDTAGDAPDTKDSGDYARIDSPDIIVTAPINSHILVNAGPGTGKTYTIIRRLEHMAKAQAVEDFGNVLVLCYTNAAKNEITKRLEAGIASGELPPETRQYDIRTFDSLATAYLSDIEDSAFASLDYNGRIARFNSRFDPEMFSSFEYVIIDEVQDLVNERAKMTVNIVESLSGGWLLCGDKCQAIYDYDCDGDNKISSNAFYKLLDAIFPSDIERYELTGNKRQSKRLAERSDFLREVLLTADPSDVNDFFRGEANDFQPIRFSPDHFADCDSGLTTAILCRSNGEAEWVSSKLHEAGIAHNLLRSVANHPTLNRWIADVFWDFCESECGRAEFAARYCARVRDDESAADFAFDAIVDAIEAALEKDVNRDMLSMDNLKRALRNGIELDERLLNMPVSHLTVSTIHKAKGREFDCVYLLNSFNPSNDSTDEARVWYVGATRPKREINTLRKLGKYFGQRTSTGRRVCKGRTRGRYGTAGYSFATHMIVGFPNDIDTASFVDGGMPEVLSVQSYIAENVKANDNIELILNNGLYDVVHNGHVIGRLTSETTQDFWAAIRTTDNRANIPPIISDVFVANIITITPYQHPSGVPRMFKESGFWLGVELTGFGKIDWHYGGGKRL